jgi:hypothetical protein
MANRAWWLSAVQWAVWGVLMALIMGWLARARLRPRPAEDRHTLEHPAATLVIGLACTAFFLAAAGLSARFSRRGDPSWPTIVLLAFVPLGAWLILDYAREQHHLEPGGLRYRRALGRSGVLRWSDVDAVRYSPGWKWFRLTATHGEVVRLSAMLMGLPEFAQTVLAEVRPGAIDDRTRPILEQTAAGAPPSVWA